MPPFPFVLPSPRDLTQLLSAPSLIPAFLENPNTMRAIVIIPELIYAVRYSLHMASLMEREGEDKLAPYLR
jgi:hypothetical protein